MEAKTIPILMYHSIQNVPKTEVMRSLHVTPRAFATQMWLLKVLGYRGCSVSEALTALDNNSTEKLVGLTFDDGYKNFLTNAMPTLIKHDFSATVYVVSDLVGTFNRWDLKNSISRNELMDYPDLRICLSEGIEVGCHSSTHRSLSNEEVDLLYEIRLAKGTLEEKLDSPVATFCYPYGHFNDQVISFVKESSFESATTMIRSRATAKDNALALPRIPITWHTMPHLFLAKVLTNYEDRRRHR